MSKTVELHAKIVENDAGEIVMRLLGCQIRAYHTLPGPE